MREIGAERGNAAIGLIRVATGEQFFGDTIFVTSIDARDPPVFGPRATLLAAWAGGFGGGNVSMLKTDTLAGQLVDARCDIFEWATITAD